MAEAIGRVMEGGEEMRAQAAGMRGEEEYAVAEAATHLRRICREGFDKYDTSHTQLRFDLVSLVGEVLVSDLFFQLVIVCLICFLLYFYVLNIDL